MATTESESLEVSRDPDGTVVIHFVLVLRSGVTFDGVVALGASAATWLIEQLDLATGDDGYPKATLDLPPDHLGVFIGGGQGYEEPNVNVINHRETNVSHPGLGVLTALSLATARDLAGRLRTLS